MSKYDFDMELADNTSTGMLIKQVEKGSTVLEFGCANGRMTRYMKENMDCKVYVAEIDPEAYSTAIQYAEDGICGDIEDLSWVCKFDGLTFDYIIFADVLEHLRNPQKVLKATTKLLKEDGSVLFSIPNVAHGDICLNMYLNQFKYMSLGLLDDTHIHMFAYEELDDFCDKAGYGISIKDAVFIDVFCTEQGKWIPEECREQLKEKLFGKKYVDIYQFIYKLQHKKYILENNIQQICNIKEDYYGIEGHVSFEIRGIEGRQDDLRVYPCNVNDGRYEFQLPIRDNTSKIIFMPVGNRGCILSDIEILSNQGIIDCYQCNGFTCEDRVIFANMNPKIVINFNDKFINYLRISMKISPFEKMDDFLLYTSLSKALRQTDIIVHEKQEELYEKEKRIKENSEQIKKLEEERESLISELEQGIKNTAKIINKTDEITDRLEKSIQFLNVYRERRDLDRIYDINNKQDYINRLEGRIGELECELKRTRFCQERCEAIDREKSIFNQEVQVGLEEVLIKGNKINPRACENNSCILDINNIVYSNVSLTERVNRKIAVHLHLYYVDLLPEFFNYFNNIPYVFDLYVSCQEDADLEDIAKKFSRLRFVNDIIVRKTQNRGRDIAPFYVLFNKEISEHDYVLHVHSKKSLYTGGEQISWRRNSLNKLVGSEFVVKKIFSILESTANIGLLFMENTDIVFWAQDWLANRGLGQQLCNEFGIEFDDGLFNYPVGSFFWARVDALEPLFAREFKYEDFPEEKGQIDGTLAHALERFIAPLTRSRGYNMAICDYDENIVRLNNSKKAYRGYFSVDTDKAFKYLRQYDVISFDIFDTLITRKVYKPDDLFMVMEAKIKKELGVDIAFKTYRKKAEQLVWNEKGAATDIQSIYKKFEEIVKVEPEIAEKIKEIEISTELEFVIPRRTMLKVFNRLKDIGKTIVLVSDMYLTSDIIEKMLQKCGYYGYKEIWVSCEKNARKDIGDIWGQFFEKYNEEKVVHVGDNLRSDIQILSDMGRNTFYVMNPLTEFKLSDQYSILKKYDDNSLSFSIIMGIIINEKLYNSPFALDMNGKCEINTEMDFGFVAFGGLMTAFMQWIVAKSDENTQLLFLAREGYFLEKLFDVYCQEKGISNIKHTYFLTSRRAMSKAAIRNIDDIRKVLEQDYNGTLGNLLKSRLDMNIDIKGLKNLEVSMPKDLDNLLNLIEQSIPSIINEAEIERKAYLEYMSSVLINEKKWVTVDLGYSGTIQYFMSKVLDKNVDGLYLCTGHNKKPVEIGCGCDEIYRFTRENGCSVIQNNSLYLEAALQAPYGQLIKFEIKDGVHEPVYKDEKIMGKGIEQLQAGMEEFVHEFLRISKEFMDGEVVDYDFVADLFEQYLHGDLINQTIADIFEVQDDYCSNGILKLGNMSNWEVYSE